METFMPLSGLIGYLLIVIICCYVLEYQYFGVSLHSKLIPVNAVTNYYFVGIIAYEKANNKNKYLTKVLALLMLIVFEY